MRRQFLKPLTINNLLVISTIIIASSCGSGRSKEEPPKKIEVTGSAEMEVVPDEIYLTITFREYLDAGKAKVKLEGIKKEFLAQCKAIGLSDSGISISAYSGNERWDYYYYRRRKKEPDFMNSISYTIKVSSPAKLDQLVANLNEKAVENFYISKTSHSRLEELRKDIKTKALLAGKTKADYLAKSIGEEIGEAILIQEFDNSPVPDFRSNLYSNMQMETDAAQGSSPDFEKIKLRFEMKVEFRLK